MKQHKERLTVSGVDQYRNPMQETIEVPIYRFPRLHALWERMLRYLRLRKRFRAISTISMRKKP